ncbi:uncharacterized protein Ga0609869_001351 [Rhodovulum iodosum]|uniref:SCP domain-containing protein n=1 Tax=Rhodovulum iodosum TaxID=68291 RepID=A0ABV3XRQ0_9RHOB|nr:CAP domain-containing protein [Rhodovulum robiginosum]RSK30346.1 CAP domain-containing protein [Rhodovulum robiginosum]
MKAFTISALFLALVLAGCDAPPPRMDATGKPLPRAYKLSERDAATVQYRMLDSVNALRSARGLTPLRLDSRLNAAALAHSRDMSAQGRAWPFGSDGSSPYDRVARAGYAGRLGTELVSQTYETELDTLAAWMEDPAKRDALLEPNAQDMGFGFYQEPNGLIWWALITGLPTIAQGNM